MTDETGFEAGELYRLDELPENQMDPDGRVEWVGDDLLAVKVENGPMLEFRMAVECTAVYEMDGPEIDRVISGRPRPLGGDGDGGEE